MGASFYHCLSSHDAGRYSCLPLSRILRSTKKAFNTGHEAEFTLPITPGLERNYTQIVGDDEANVKKSDFIKIRVLLDSTVLSDDIFLQVR